MTRTAARDAVVPPSLGRPARIEAAARGRTAVLLALFLASGFAALVYQVLWVRQLGLLFGSTAQAASIAIAIFFAGLATGGAYWGRRAPRLRSSLWGFGVLEVAVGLTALGHLALLGLYHAAYPWLYAAVGAATGWDTLLKAVIAAVVLLPPSFLMGGTFPLMGQHLVRGADRLAETGSTLYAVNTVGAAAGALAAGFVLPLALGMRAAYLLAVAIDVAVGVTAMAMARRGEDTDAAVPAAIPATPADPATTAAPGDPVASPSPSEPLPGAVVWAVAAVSGFATLAVEVLWTRLFAQVLQNSAYTYALVLATFLVALAAGAALAGRLSRLPRPAPHRVLGGLLALASVVTATSPWLFHRMTGGLDYLGRGLDWGGYVVAVAGVAAVAMLLPGVVLGMVLPYLLRVLQGDRREPGELIGRLVAVNTVGAIAGSLVAGFLLLPALGAVRSIVVVAAAYPALIALLAVTRAPRRRWAVAAPAVALAVGLLVGDTGGLRAVRFGDGPGERVVEVREGASATVAVVARYDEQLLRVNNHYTLGSTRGMSAERDQTVIPMLLHPQPRSVFYLGLGTGITAGASLDWPLERIVACELVPEVIGLAREHFGIYARGLFDDPRVTIHAEDGRTCLRRSPDTYDLIVSDLFTPWKAGTGNLYTREHFEVARDRLEPGGLFVQWLPLYQLSERELGVVAATMTDVFDQVTMWRGDLFADRSIVALVGHEDAAPFDPSVPVRQARHLDADGLDDAALEAVALRLYAGNVTEAGLFDAYERNTVDRPLIEYLAPRTHRDVRAGRASFLTGEGREELYAALRDAVPFADDPYLSRLTDEQLGYVAAGGDDSRHRWLAHAGGDTGDLLTRYLDGVPDAIADARSASGLLLPP